MTELNNLIRVARGDAPADIVLRNAKLVNVYSGEIYPADVAIHNARIAGIGSNYHGAEEIDLKGAYLAPGSSTRTFTSRARWSACASSRPRSSRAG